MKLNKIVLVSLIACSSMLYSCNKDTISSSSATSSSSSSQSAGEITAVEISGPSNVELGKKATFTADVIGNDDDSVTWAFSSETVGTVSQTGVFTTKAVGKGVLTATSTIKNTVFGTYEVNVYAKKATSVTLLISSAEELPFDNVTKTYSIPLNHDFKLSLSQTDNSKPFDSVSFSSSLPESISFDAVVIEQSEKTAKGYAIQAFSGGTLIAKCYYSDEMSTPLTASIKFDIIDGNKEASDELKSFISSTKAQESSYLLSGKISSSKMISSSKDGENVVDKVDTVSSYASYTNASYTKKNTKTYKNESPETDVDSSYFSGLDTSSNNYYALGFDSSDVITDVFANTSITDQNTSDSTLFFNPKGNTYSYGIAGYINDMFFSSTTVDGDFVTFYDSECYANSVFSKDASTYKIASSFKGRNDNTDYSVNLTINYEDTKITGFEFTESFEAENSRGTISYKGTDFVFGNKIEDNALNNPDHRDLSSYYITSFTMKEISGTKTDLYDYTNLSKYGPNSVSTTDGGLTKYTLSYDKTLVLQVSDIAPTGASVEFDDITYTSSDTTKVPVKGTTGGGIFAISAYTDNSNNHAVGEATLTFKSAKGVEVKVVVEFTAVELKGITVDHMPTGNDFGDVFKGDKTSYFLLNTDPDELSYSFGLRIVSGNKDGISLYDYEDGNIEGVPGAGFSVLGNEIGSYTFKLYVVGHEDIETEDTYSINIVAPYSAEHLKTNLVGKSFVKDTGTLKDVLTFTSDTLITIVETSTTETLIDFFAYHFEEGHVVIDNDYDTKGLYYERIYKGNIYYSNDFSSIYFYASTNDGDSSTVATNKAKVEFSKYVTDAEIGDYVDGKAFAGENFIIGIGMCKATLTFAKDTGTITLYSNASKTDINTVAFSYTYSAGKFGNFFTVSNVSGTLDSGISAITDNQFEYLNTTRKIVVKMTIKGGSSTFSFDIAS